MNQVVTFTGFEEKKRGTNQRGEWALRIFTSAGGDKFQTFDVSLGDQVISSINSPVEVEYEIEDNGNFKNNVIRSVKAVAAGVSTEVAKALVASGQASVYTLPSDDRELRIMRQSGLDRAINTVAAGIAEAKTVNDLFALSDEYIRYFQNGVAEKF